MFGNRILHTAWQAHSTVPEHQEGSRDGMLGDGMLGDGMHGDGMLGDGIMAREFDRRAGALQVRAAAPDTFTAPGIPEPARGMGPSGDRGHAFGPGCATKPPVTPEPGLKRV